MEPSNELCSWFCEPVHLEVEEPLFEQIVEVGRKTERFLIFVGLEPAALIGNLVLEVQREN